MGVDLVELSGGSYESPVMSGRPADARTRASEAYFLDLAKDLVTTSPLPLMLTGGITRRATAEQALADGVALIEMGTALAVTPDLPARWRDGREADRYLRPVNWLDKALASAAGMAQVRHQLRRLARGTHRPTPCSPNNSDNDEHYAATAPGCLRHEAPQSRTGPRKHVTITRKGNAPAVCKDCDAYPFRPVVEGVALRPLRRVQAVAVRQIWTRQY
ncbi:hypothetical protein [Streptomyces chrestomyceticus]|uniref:hypothetical protein n=1 Tax=Streptomyces chrestomyceticus TaxID=68185 RepID=UPI0035A91F57